MRSAMWNSCLIVLAVSAFGGAAGLPKQQHDMISVSDPQCNCTFVRSIFLEGGCVITGAAPPNTACKCFLNEITALPYFYFCTSQVVACKDKDSHFCKNPDTSYESCLQGQGNCVGYLRSAPSQEISYPLPSCACRWNFKLNTGCIIIDAAPSGLACQCNVSDIHIYPPLCFGTVVACKDNDSPFCENPDTSINSCKQGQGNCDGYIKNKNSCTALTPPGFWIPFYLDSPNCSYYNAVPTGIARPGGICCQNSDIPKCGDKGCETGTCHLRTANGCPDGMEFISCSCPGGHLSPIICCH